MKVFVLGASGLVGNAIVRELLARDCRVTAMSRQSECPKNLTGLDIEYVRGDLDEDLPLESWLAEHDALIDAAAPYALHLYERGYGSRKTPVELAARRTRRLLDALSRADVRFAYVSTLLTEASNAIRSVFDLQKSFSRSIHPYFSIKKQIEEQVLEASEHGLDSVVIRCSACIGPWDVKPSDACWVPALVNGKFAVTPDHRVNLIDSRDVACGLVDALLGGYSGRPIALTGHNTTIRSLFSMVCETAGVASPLWNVPAAFGVIPSLWAEFALAGTRRRSPLPALIPMLLCEQQWADPSEAQRQLRLEPRPLVDTVADTLAWYRQMQYC